jgi:phenylacetate-CoA ligase
MPFIRYDTGDVTSIKNKPCTCGRQSPLIEDITTKAEDIVTTIDGRYIAPVALTHPFKPISNIVESQIIQESPDHILIKIVRGPDYNSNDSEKLLTEFKKRLGDGMKFELEFVEFISRTSAGKLRWVISKVPFRI